MDNFPLLLEGIATSTFWRGESLSQKAITGTFTYDASLTACRVEPSTNRIGPRTADVREEKLVATAMSGTVTLDSPTPLNHMWYSIHFPDHAYLSHERRIATTTITTTRTDT